MIRRSILVALAGILLVTIPVQAGPLENHGAIVAGAERLLDDQFGDGSFPWIVGDPGKFQNVQGVTALGLLDAFTVTGDRDYLGGATTGAQGTRNWLINYMVGNPDAFISSSNTYFLAKYALVGAAPGGLSWAEEAFQRAIDSYGGATELAEGILEARVAQNHTNLGVWDVALFIRAAQDIGNTSEADAMAAVLEDQVATGAIVDPFDAGANWYELGLAGLLFGLGESDAFEHQAILREAAQSIKLAQCANGSFTATWQGVKYCDDVQSTAYAVLGLTHALQLVPEAQEGCDFLAASQVPPPSGNSTARSGGWDLGGYEIAEVNAEAISALVACILPLHNGATSYANAYVPGV